MRARFHIVAMALMAIVSGPAQAGWQDAPEVKALYEKAKAEGKVVVWGTQRNEVDWMPQAFNAMFPGIEVQWVADNDIATKAIAEARGGRHEIDVFWSTLTGIAPVMQRDLIAKTDWTPFEVPAATTGFDGRMAYTHNTAYAFAYNRDLTNTADLPKNWGDLTDPKYKGTMTSSLFLMPRLIGALSLPWGNEKAVQFARDVTTKQDVLLTRAPREPIVNSGERKYAMGEIDSLVRIWRNAGLHIDYVIPEPVVLVQGGGGVMAKAPHPNAARLFAGYLASPEGKAARKVATNSEDYGPTGTNEVAKLINAGKLQAVRDLPELMAQREKAISQIGPIVAGQR